MLSMNFLRERDLGVYCSTFGTRAFSVADRQSGIHCLIICGIQLLTVNNVGRTWRSICSPDIWTISTLQVFM